MKQALRIVTGLAIGLCGTLAPTALAHPNHTETETSPATGFAMLDQAANAAKADAENDVTIEIRGDYRYITANGIPDHQPGRFPNRGNPNTITEQRHRYRVPAQPEVADETTRVIRQPFGVAINGVPFDPATAGFWDPENPHGRPTRDRSSGWNYEALSGTIDLGLDRHNAHVQSNGAYHYHGIPEGIVAIHSENDPPAMVLVGDAADGFPIYARWAYDDVADTESEVRVMQSSYRLKEGDRPDNPASPEGDYDGTFTLDFEYIAGLGDLDECNGRTGPTPEYPEGTYYYVLTDDYPFVPRLFRGTPDPSFERHGPAAGGNRPGQPGRDRGPRDGRPPRRGDRLPPPR